MNATRADDDRPTEACEPMRESLGALVLGGLEPGEREAVETHVQQCQECATTLSELAPVPGLLNRVDTADLELVPPPPELLERALAQARAQDLVNAPAPASPGWRRRRGALVLGGAAAAAVVVVLALVWTNVLGPDSTPTGPVAVSADPGATVSASVTMNPTPTGTELALDLTGVPPGEHCELVAVGHDGTREVAASWVASYEGEAHVTGATGLAIDQIATLEVATPEGQKLATLTVPPQS